MIIFYYKACCLRTICINSFNSFKGIVTFTSIYKYMLKFWPCNFEPARCMNCPRIWAFGTSNINNKLNPALARPSTVRGPASTHEALKRIEPLTTKQQNPYKPQDGFSNVDWSIKRKSRKKTRSKSSWRRLYAQSCRCNYWEFARRYLFENIFACLQRPLAAQ